jgi:predicted site-specific integrase-resolvase
VSQLLTPEELANRLQLSTWTLAHWRSQGVGPIWTKVGSRIRYALVDVEVWQAQQRRGTTKEVAR